MSRRRTSSPLLIGPLDPHAGEPLHRQVHEAVRDAILAGRLRPGARLPSSRDLARELGVSRNTVLTAFDSLMSEGYTEARTGSGTRVSMVLPEALLVARPEEAAASTAAEPPRTAAVCRNLPNVPAGHRPRQKDRPLAHGIPDLGHFPFTVWNRLLGRFWRHPPRDLLLHGDLAGYAPLRAAIADYLCAVRALNCTAEQVIITSGAQQALAFALRLLLDPGDRVWLENPGYAGLHGAAATAGVEAVPVPVDADGLDVAEGIRLAPDARAAAVTPSHHYPLGATMSLPRRLALLEWAGRVNAWIIEDDYDSEFRYAGRPLSALQGLDRGGRVIYVGTFSKVMFPALRVGYLIVPPSLIEPTLRLRHALDDHPPIAVQPALAAFIEQGQLAAHVRRMRGIYGERQQALLAALRRHLAGALEISGHEAGMHLCTPLSPDTAKRLDDREIARRAGERGLVIDPLARFFIRPDGRQGLVLGYAAFPERRLEAAAEALARVVAP